jgi:hypothetical protein
MYWAQSGRACVDRNDFSATQLPVDHVKTLQLLHVNVIGMSMLNMALSLLMGLECDVWDGNSAYTLPYIALALLYHL